MISKQDSNLHTFYFEKLVYEQQLFLSLNFQSQPQEKKSALQKLFCRLTLRHICAWLVKKRVTVWEYQVMLAKKNILSRLSTTPLYFVALNNLLPFTISLCAPCSDIYSLSFVKQITHYFPIFLPSLRHVNNKFSRHSFLLICSQTFNCHFPILRIGFPLVPILLKTSSFLTCSSHGILIIH